MSDNFERLNRRLNEAKKARALYREGTEQYENMTKRIEGILADIHKLTMDRIK